MASPQPFLTDTDYESMPIHWKDCEDYEIIRKVRRCQARHRLGVLFHPGWCYKTFASLRYAASPHGKKTRLILPSHLTSAPFLVADAMEMWSESANENLGGMHPACQIAASDALRLLLWFLLPIQVGRGKYSEVFEGWKVSGEEKVSHLWPLGRPLQPPPLGRL